MANTTPTALDRTCIAPQLLLVTPVLCSCVATTAYQFYLLRLFSAVASLLLVQFYRCQCYLLRLFSAVASVTVLLVTAVLCGCICASATCYGCSQQLHLCQCYLLRLFSAVASLPLCDSASCSVLPVPVLRVTVVLCSCIATTVYQWYLYSFIGASGRCYS